MELKLMSTTSGRIDTTEFKPASGITKFFLFLIISICIIAYYFSELNQMYIAGILKFFQYFLGIIFGIIGGFIGVSIGRYIQTNVGAVRVYEKSVLDIFSRKIMLKIGPGLAGCVLGVFIAIFGTITIFKPATYVYPDSYTEIYKERQHIYLYEDGTGYILCDGKATNFIKWRQDGYKLIFDIYDENGGHNESYASVLTKEDEEDLKRKHKYGTFSWNENFYKRDASDYNYKNLKKNMEKQ